MIGCEKVSLVGIQTIKPIDFADVRQAKESVSANSQQSLNPNELARHSRGRSFPYNQRRSRRTFGVHVASKLS